MMQKLLSIETEYVAILREILSNAHLEEATLAQSKQVQCKELSTARIALRKRARELRIEREYLLKSIFQTLGVLDFDNVYDAILSIFPTTDIGEISELKHLEWQRQLLIEKTLLQLKSNKNLRSVMKHLTPLPPAPDVAKKKKTLIL